MINIIKNLESEDKVKALPLIEIKEKNIKTHFLSKLYLMSYEKNLHFSMISPEIYSWHYLKPRKNMIVFDDFERIMKIRYFKTFDTKTRPQTIVNAQHKINYAKFNEHIYLDIKENCLFIDTRFFNSLNSNTNEILDKQLFYALYIFKHQLPDELKEQFVGFIKSIKEITLKQIEETFDIIVRHLSSLSTKRMITNSAHIVGRKQQSYLRSRQSTLKKEKEKILEEIRRKQSSIDSTELNIQKLDNFPEEFYNFINRFFKEKQITYINSDGTYLNIFTNYLTVDFLNNIELEKLVDQNQLGLNDKRLEAIRKVLNYEANFAIMPIKIEILTDFSFAEANCHKPLGIRFYPLIGGDSYTNLHSIYNNRRGCLGSFKVEFEIAQSEEDLKRLIVIALQYLRSLTVHDPAGNDMIRRIIIIDNNEFIINCPVKPILEGLKITDLIQNEGLFYESDTEIMKYKEEKYGNQSNAE